MKSILTPQSVRGLTLAAAAVLLLSTAPHQRAEAMSLITPGATPATKAATDDLVTPVRHGGHGGGGFHGGGFRGGGFHGGGFRGFHGGGFRGGGWHGGRAHFGGFHHGGFRGFHHFGGHRFAHFHHRRVFFGGVYPAYYPYYAYPPCRVIWTYYGPRRVCGYRHWYGRYY